mgnify:CR=1 FL=1
MKKFKVQFGEEAVEVEVPDDMTPQEIMSGYLRQSDYTRKRQEEAHRHREVARDGRHVPVPARLPVVVFVPRTGP